LSNNISLGLKYPINTISCFILAIKSNMPFSSLIYSDKSHWNYIWTRSLMWIIFHFDLYCCSYEPWMTSLLVKKLIGYQPFFSWVDENHNVITCFILLVKVAKIMLIWLPCVVMKTCHEMGITFNRRMTNWGFGMLKWTTTTSSTRHLNSSKNFITFAFETMWILINFVCDVTCVVTFICW